MTPGQNAIDAELDRLSEHLPADVREEIRNNENVHGTGLGYRERGGVRTDEPAFIVYVLEKTSEESLSESDVVPRSISLSNGETLQTDVQGTDGEFVAQASEMRDMQIRPMLGGTLIETPFARTGTTTGKMYTTDGRAVVVTPYHIVSEGGEVPSGTEVYQPDRHSQANYIGSVTDWSNYTESPTLKNTNDSALIEVGDSNALGYTLGFGQITDTGQARLGDHLISSSAAGGIRSGAVAARNVNIRMTMPWGSVAEYSGLVTFDTPGLAGMSGAPIIRINPGENNRTIVGMHIGGTNSGRSIMVPWQAIENRFGLLSPPANDPAAPTSTEVQATEVTGEPSSGTSEPFNSSMDVSESTGGEDDDSGT